MVKMGKAPLTTETTIEITTMRRSVARQIHCTYDYSTATLAKSTALGWAEGEMARGKDTTGRVVLMQDDKDGTVWWLLDLQFQLTAVKDHKVYFKPHGVWLDQIFIT